MAKHKLIALSNAVPGQEAEFERWYDQQHIPDILGFDGFLSAQRFNLAAQPGPPGTPSWSTMVIYDIETDDLAACMDQLRQHLRTPRLPISDAIDMATGARLLATPATKVFEKKK